jgi:hypothetical protein
MRQLPKTLVALALAATSSSAFPMNTEFSLVNQSTDFIFEVYISSVHATNWGSDQLGDEVLGPGRQKTFNPGSSQGCFYDIRVVYEGGREEEVRRRNLCELSEVSFSGSNASKPSGSSRGGSNVPPPVSQRPSSTFYDGAEPLRCGLNVTCRNQSEVVQRMQMRWAAFSRLTPFSTTCLEAIQRIKSMHPASYGDGNPGWVQPQMDICNLR